MATIQREMITSVSGDVELLEPSYAVGENVKWCSCFVKVWQFLKRLNIELTYDPPILLICIYPRESKTYVHTKLAPFASLSKISFR